MNGPNDKPTKRFHEHAVTLYRGPETLTGTRFYFYPVDEPPVIAVPTVDREWYEEVWVKRGWTVDG